MKIPPLRRERGGRRTDEPLRRLAVLAVIAALWLLSLALPALRVAGGPVLQGIDVLLQGWQGAAHGIVAWYANPLGAAAFALAALQRFRAAALAAGLASLAALTSVFVEPILELQMSRAPQVSLLIGFYAWLAAIVALLSWSAKRARSERGHMRRIRDARPSAGIDRPKGSP